VAKDKIKQSHVFFVCLLLSVILVFVLINWTIVVEDDEIISLTEDKYFEHTLIIPEGTNVTINGNGYQKRWGFIDAPAVEIESGAMLTLHDVYLTGPGELLGSDLITLAGVGIVIREGGTLIMAANSAVQRFEVGVIVNGGRFVLDGGTVAYNADASSFSRGGGIRVLGGEVVMRSGEVRNNAARTAGGIFVSGPAHIELHGGEIRNNSAMTGGGVFIDPPNPYALRSYDQTVTIEIGSNATNVIFDNIPDDDIRWVEGGPGIQGIVINNLANFIESHDANNSKNLVLILH